MKTFKVRIGDGNANEKYTDFVIVRDWHLLRGIKGRVHLHLYGQWWRIISPQDLSDVLLNLNCNPTPPLVTVGL